MLKALQNIRNTLHHDKESVHLHKKENAKMKK